MSLFDDIGGMPPIEVFELNKLYTDDPSPLKVSLGVGAYRTDEGKPWVLPGKHNYSYYSSDLFNCGAVIRVAYCYLCAS